MEEEKSGFRIRLVPEISVADILTIVMIGGPVLVWGGKMDSRIDFLEKQSAAQAATDARQDEQARLVRLEIREELRAINQLLVEVKEKLARHDGETMSSGRKNGR